MMCDMNHRFNKRPEYLQDSYILHGSQEPHGLCGPEGPRGPRGPRGHRGHHGHHGHKGTSGENGSQGPTGPTGPHGPSGENGTRGPTGPRGNPGQKYLEHRIYVGPVGDYQTLKEAVDWFNSNASSDSQILVDGGHYPINDTITINNPNYVLKINGLGYQVTYFDADIGLSGKPMFNIASESYLYQFTAYGNTLPGYGTLDGENFITFDTTADNYCEFNDFVVNGFNIGFSDLIGVSYFMSNFGIEDCVTAGIQVNYNTTTVEQTIDIEIGDIVNCGYAINLQQTGTGRQSLFLVDLFFGNSLGQTAVQYNVGVYLYGVVTMVSGCNYNMIGTFLGPGFDFSNPINADFEITGCIGVEDKSPYGTLYSSTNTLTTTATTAGVYYPISVDNFSISACKYALTDSGVLYLSHHPCNQAIFLSGSFSSNSANVCNISFAITRVLNVLTVIGDGSTTTVTTSTPHNLTQQTQVQLLGWSGGTGTWDGVVVVSSTPSGTIFTYSSTGSGTATGGNALMLISPVAVYMSQQDAPYSFGLTAFMPRLIYGDIINFCIMSSIDNTDAKVISISAIIKK